MRCLRSPPRNAPIEAELTPVVTPEVLLSQGQTVQEAVRQLGIAEQTYYRWLKEYGGLDKSQAARLKELERENLRLKQRVAELALDKSILEEALSKK